MKNITHYCDIVKRPYLTNIKGICRHYIDYHDRFLQYKEMDMSEHPPIIPDFNPYQYATAENNYNPYVGHSCQAMYMDIESKKQVIFSAGSRTEFIGLGLIGLTMMLIN